MATRHRPSRGKAGPEIELGDPFGQYEKQGGAQPGATESGDLQSREFGVPQADIPGGLNHLVNTETHPAKTVHKGAQPADYHKFHGVPPIDEDLYSFPQQADHLGHQPKASPEPKIDEAVPVRIVQAENERHPIRKLIAEGPQAIASTTTDPVRIADRDAKRVKFWICNENLATQAGSSGTIGSQTSPAANTVITTQTLAAGVYTVAWTVELSGTLAAGDANNFGLFVAGPLVATSLNTATAAIFAQPGLTVVVPAGGGIVNVRNIGLATTGAVYQAQLIVTPAAASAPAIRIGDWETTADNRGLLVPAGMLKDFVTQDAVFVTNQSGSTVTISFGYETEIEGTG